MSAAMGLVLCLVATFVSQSAAHFLLNYPPTIGFDDSLESQSPCGSFTPDFSTDNVTNFYVGGDSLAMTSIHPEATWLFRATLDQTASGNWTDLLPAVTQTGLGDYCEPNVLVPSPWAGSKGIIGVVQDAPDGILYQCAAVNFVAGKGTVPSVCTNGTGLTAVFAADPSLSNLPTSASATGSSTGTAPSTSSTVSTTSKPSAATTVSQYGGLGSAVWVGMVGFATVMALLF